MDFPYWLTDGGQPGQPDLRQSSQQKREGLPVLPRGRYQIGQILSISHKIIIINT